jgi:hypothetical protein
MRRAGCRESTHRPEHNWNQQILILVALRQSGTLLSYFDFALAFMSSSVRPLYSMLCILSMIFRLFDYYLLVIRLQTTIFGLDVGERLRSLHT